MSNNIHVGGMYGLDSLISGMQKKVSQTTSNLSYKDMLASIQAQAETATESVSETKSTSEMTMEEYQSYIWDKIDSFPFSPTRPFDEQVIKISDKCWNRMKSDPEYEEKMMNIIKDGRMYPNPFYAMGDKGAYEVLEFDGGEGCYSHTWSKNFGGSTSSAKSRFDNESDGGFWSSTRTRKKKQQAEVEEAIFAQRKMMQEISDEIAYKRHMEMKAASLGEKSEYLLTGVPAEFLLSGLMGGSMATAF